MWTLTQLSQAWQRAGSHVRRPCPCSQDRGVPHPPGRDLLSQDFPPAPVWLSHYLQHSVSRLVHADRRVVIARAAQAVLFPARFMLVAATNPCPCGGVGAAPRLPLVVGAPQPPFNDGGTACRCSAADIARYRARLSGPLADRLDLRVTVAPIALSAMHDNGNETSATVRARVVAARDRQRARYAALDGVRANAQAPTRALRGAHGPTSEAHAWLVDAASRLRLSARGYSRVLRVARTIADLDGAERVERDAVAEALRFRGEG